ncbi:MAG: Xaa-Pro peptidase family protein [Candidatus Hydrothermarchaeales archaeon]
MASRLDDALHRLSEKDLKCGIVLKPENIFYLTGFFPSATSALLLKDEPTLLVSRMDAAPAEASLVKFKVVEKVGSEIKRLRYKGMGVEKNFTSFGFIEKNLKGKKIHNLDFIEDMRKIKGKKEVDTTKKAIKIAEDAARGVESEMEGKTEREVAASLEYSIRKHAQVAFEAIVASGRNSSVPHHSPTEAAISAPVIIDVGAKVDYYNSDLSRTFTMGSPSNVLEVYEAVSEAQKAGIKECYDGNDVKAADLAVRGVLDEYNLEEYFLHSSGHGMGLEVHEEPRISKDSKEKFREGMVVTIEPGVYKEFGVRIEDVVLVGKQPRVLTSLPR